MPPWRKQRLESPNIDDRAWSARSSVHPRAASEDLVHYTALPAETGPTWAPDRLSVWPVEGGRYGIDAHYHGSTGLARAERPQRRLLTAGLRAGVRRDDRDTVLRLGPLGHQAVWLALEAFLGRPMIEPQPDDGQ
jgi:hypothetical protein